MNKLDQDKYLDLVSKKLEECSSEISRLKEMRNSSESAMTSRYDTQREELDSRIRRMEEIILGLDNFKIFLESGTDKTIIEDGATFSVNYQDNGDKLNGLLFAPFPVAIDGLTIITSSSPLGKAVKGKTKGEDFTYEFDSKNLSGVITEVT